MTHLGRFACFMAAFLLAVLPALLQASSTSVRGSVHDPADAVIPRAVVRLTNNATGVDRETVTNEAGLYVFPDVFPGPYRLTATFPGMHKYEANLTAQVQQEATVDVVLQLETARTQVVVKDVTPLVTTGNATLGHTLDLS